MMTGMTTTISSVLAFVFCFGTAVHLDAIELQVQIAREYQDNKGDVQHQWF
jgi:hypothetical protein